MTIGLRFALTGALLMPSLALAQTTPAATSAPKAHHQDSARHAVMVACRPIIGAHCQGIDRKGGRVMACLAASPEPLPSSCRDALGAFAKSKHDAP